MPFFVYQKPGTFAKILTKFYVEIICGLKQTYRVYRIFGRLNVNSPEYCAIAKPPPEKIMKMSV